MTSSNDPAAASNNYHHTVPYRSYDEWAEQFDPDPATGEPNMFEPGEVERINQHIIDHMGDPLDLDSWSDEVDTQAANLPARVAESATRGRR